MGWRSDRAASSPSQPARSRPWLPARLRRLPSSAAHHHCISEREEPVALLEGDRVQLSPPRPCERLEQEQQCAPRLVEVGHEHVHYSEPVPWANIKVGPSLQRPRCGGRFQRSHACRAHSPHPPALLFGFIARLPNLPWHHVALGVHLVVFGPGCLHRLERAWPYCQVHRDHDGATLAAFVKDRLREVEARGGGSHAAWPG